LGIGGEAALGWVELRLRILLFVKAAVFWGGVEGEGRERPTRSGRENAVEGGHWPMGAAVASSWPPATEGVCDRSRGAIGFAQSTVVRRLEDW
jgi:hypothetical protein